MSAQQHLDALIWAAAADSSVERSEAEQIRVHAEALAAVEDDAVPGQLRQRLDELVARAAQVAAGDSGAAGTLRALLRELLSGGGDSLGAPLTPEEEAEEDLLAIFIAAGTDALSEIESSILVLENSEDLTEQADATAALRREIHTLKGECGILSLHAAQSVWHEAETLIDVAASSERELPTDLLMATLDWHRDQLTSLSDESPSAPPAHGPLLESLRSWNTSAESVDRFSDLLADDALDAWTEGETITFSEELLMDESVPEFVTEARQHLEDSEAALFELEDDAASSDGIDRIFRAFHTIKGVAGFLGVKPIVDLAHVVETLLDRFRSSDLEFTSAHADIVLESKDMMEKLFLALIGEVGPSSAGLQHLVAQVAKVAQDPTGTVAFGSRAVRSVLANAGMKDDYEFERAALHPAKASTLLGRILVSKGELTEEQLEAGLARQSALRDQGNSIRIGEVLVILGVVSKAQLDAALEMQSTARSLVKLLEAEVPAKPPAAQSERSRRAKFDSTIRVSTQRLDSLVDMVGELVIAQQMVVQGAEGPNDTLGEELDRNISHLGKITRDLQEASMSLRMVTFQSTFQKMHRLVRDVAAKAGKSIRLEIQGADTEVDRNIVDKISDPLVHLVRNAIDHGIESPEGRELAGKTPQGKVVLSARHQGGAIVVSLKDDGRGLDRDRILAKARATGLIAHDRDDAEMSDSAVYKLIFEPGFSTAAAVTDISGRGVGMDVVKRNIEAMRGKVEILSEPGQGAEFRIQLPLTLAIIDAMIVSCNSERYVIPTLSIVQSFRPSREQLHAIKGESPMVEVRGQLVPMHRLDQVLDGGTRCLGESTVSTLILVEGMGRGACLIVDEIIGQQQVVIKKLGPCRPPARVVSGGAILGDGRVALIVDIEGVLAETESVALC